VKEEIESEIRDLWNNHRSSSVGVVVGVMFSVFVLAFGFWNVLFVILCASIGLYIGTKIDNGENVLTRLCDYVKEHWKRG
jgi:uncharacterized membrane protein